MPKPYALLNGHPTTRQMFRASVYGHGAVLDAINQLEETVCGIYRDAEAEAYSGELAPWALALKVKGRLADALAECGDRLNACRETGHVLPDHTAHLG